MTPHCHQHHTGIFNLVAMAPLPLLCWRCPPCSTSVCLIMTLLAMHRGTLHCYCACHAQHALITIPDNVIAVALSSSFPSAGVDMPTALPVQRPCWPWHCTVVVCTQNSNTRAFIIMFCHLIARNGSPYLPLLLLAVPVRKVLLLLWC